MARRVLAVEAQMMRHQSPYVTALQKTKQKKRSWKWLQT